MAVSSKPLLSLGLLLIASQARGANITVDLGVIGPVLPSYETNYNIAELILVDPMGVAGFIGNGLPGTQITNYNTELYQLYNIAPTTGVYDFNFSVPKESTLNAKISTYFPTYDGSISADLFQGTTTLAENVNMISTFLKPNTPYTLEVTAVVPQVGIGSYTIFGAVAPVPLPATLFPFGLVVAGLAGINWRRHRGTS